MWIRDPLSELIGAWAGKALHGWKAGGEGTVGALAARAFPRLVPSPLGHKWLYAFEELRHAAVAVLDIPGHADESLYVEICKKK